MTDYQFILSKVKNSSITDVRQQAYVLASIRHETAGTFKPVKEGYWIKNNRIEKLYEYYQKNNPKALKTIFPNGLSGINYLGRGLVQATHDYNYEKFGELLGIDLLGNPDLALEPETAWQITEQGMTKGLFTGFKLSDYFNDKITDFTHARKIINGLDHAVEIAGYAKDFLIKLSLPDPDARGLEIIS